MFSEDVYLDLLCSSVREPEPFYEKVGAGAVYQKSHTALQHWNQCCGAVAAFFLPEPKGPNAPSTNGGSETFYNQGHMF